ncbi:MAG: hypothetical protein KAS02_01630 [Candidatus Pacebacteria bacterium]|nr:hypothetical protein [Candidatus Paceibacterota bacterium]
MEMFTINTILGIAVLSMVYVWVYYIGKNQGKGLPRKSLKENVTYTVHTIIPQSNSLQFLLYLKTTSSGKQACYYEIPRNELFDSNKNQIASPKRIPKHFRVTLSWMTFWKKGNISGKYVYTIKPHKE